MADFLPTWIMNKNISYKILPNLRLIVESYFGTFNGDDYIELKKSQLRDERFNSLYNNIADIRNSELSISNDDIRKCVEFMKSEKGLAGKRRAAVLTGTPNQVVISTLFASYGIELPMQFEIVSTLGAAMEWAKVASSDYSIVEGILSGLNEGVKLQ